MKKKNLLALSALVLSLGLTVSSCAGAQGEKGDQGDKGDQGEQGPQGEQGIPGEPGKSFVDIIVLPSVTNDGKVTQDKWAVEAGANETVTFTFTPAESTDNLVIDLKINDTVVADVVEPNEDGTLTFAFTVDDSYQSVQVTNVTFTSVSTYGQLLLQDAGKAIVDADKGINLTYTAGTSGQVPFIEDSKDVVANNYTEKATETVQKVYSDAEKAVNTAYTNAVKDHKDDVKAQLNAIKEAANAEIEKINTAYATALTEAKDQAKVDLNTMVTALNNENYLDADKTAQRDSFTAKIDAATSLVSLGNVINGEVALSTFGDKDSEANRFYGLKAKAFEEAEAALDSVEKFETELEDETTLALLKQYVETTELPSEVAKTELAKISSATEINWVKDSTNGDHTDVGYAAAEAIKGSVENIKDAIVKKVKADYRAEIENSAALASLNETRTALLGVVDTAISNFVTADKDNTLSLAQYVTPTYVPDSVNEADKSIKNSSTITLIGYIEYCLSQPVNGSVVTAFANERIQSAKSTALKSLKAAKDAINDATYKALTSYSVNTTTNKVTVSKNVVGTGDVTKTVENPFFNNIPDSPTDNKYEVELTDLVKPTLVTGAQSFNLDEYYKLLEKEETFGVAENETVYGTLHIQEWAKDHLTDFDKIYFEGLTKIKNSLTTAVDGVVTLDENGPLVKKSDVTKMWTDLDVEKVVTPEYNNAAQIISFADGVKTNADLLVKLNSGFKTWLDQKAKVDDKFADHFANDTSSTMAEDAKKVVESALKGEMSENEIENWVKSSNLESLYKADIAAYIEDAKDYALQVYQNSIAGDITLEKYKANKKVYEESVAVLTGENAPDTIREVDSWIKQLRIGLGLDKTSLPTGLGVESVAGQNTSYGSFTWTNSSNFKMEEDTTSSTHIQTVYKLSGDAIVQDSSADVSGFWGQTGTDLSGSKVYVLTFKAAVGTKIKTGYVSKPGTTLGLAIENWSGDKVEEVKLRTIESSGSMTLVVPVSDIGSLKYAGLNMQIEVLDIEGDVVHTYYFDASGLN